MFLFQKEEAKPPEVAKEEHKFHVQQPDVAKPLVEKESSGCDDDDEDNDDARNENPKKQQDKTLSPKEMTIWIDPHNDQAFSAGTEDLVKAESLEDSQTFDDAEQYQQLNDDTSPVNKAKPRKESQSRSSPKYKKTLNNSNKDISINASNPRSPPRNAAYSLPKNPSPSRVSWKAPYDPDNQRQSATFQGWETIWERFTTGSSADSTPASRQLLRQWISLPTIAVLGDTSCGKSSLLSQLAGCLELPSSHEITTKCPTELQMRYSSHQSATIDIQWNSDAAVAAKKSRVRLWDQRVLRTPEEWKRIPDVLLEAQDVILKQQAIPYLDERSPRNEKEDPDMEPVTRGSPKNSQVTVASDVISITLTGPIYPKQQTLTLIDLPGLVQGRHNALTESPTVSEEVLGVLEPYLENPRCLLVTVLPANVDYHNAHALKLAAEYDPDCQRTCLVWTKPDLIDKGAEPAVAEWLQQAPEVLGCRHVHMVKCRGQAALTESPRGAGDRGPMTLTEALEEEEAYFAHSTPWNELDPTLFGTTNLRKKLCHLQACLVQESLPSVVKDAQAQLVQTARQLQAMGGRPLASAGERRQYYQQICQRLLQHLQTSLSGKGVVGSGSSNGWKTDTDNTFVSSLLSSPPPPPPSALPPSDSLGTIPTVTSSNSHSNALSGSSSKTLAANRLHEACSVFTKQIKQGSLATIKLVCEGAQVLVTSARGTVRGEVVHLDEEEGYCCVDSSSTSNAAASAAASAILFEFTGQPFDGSNSEMSTAMENDVWSDGTSVFIARGGGVYDALRKIPLDCVWSDPTTWLQTHMEQFRTDDLPCFLNVESFSSIVRDFMREDWKPACQQLLDRMKSILQQALQQAMENALEGPGAPAASASPKNSSLSRDTNPRYPALRQLLQKRLRQVADKLVHDAATQVESSLAMEAHPFTQDSALFEKMNQARYSRLKRELEVALLAELENNGPNRSPARSSSNHSVMSKSSSASCANGSVDAVQGILDDVFGRHEKMSVSEHLAFEMEIVLESYGEIATRRVLDRTPMLCWHVFRAYGTHAANVLAAVTDTDLGVAMTERAEFAQEFEALTNKYDTLQDAIRVLEDL